MRRAIALGLVLLVIGALAPATTAAAGEYTFVGTGSARVLDLDLPVLRVAGAQGLFKGLTLGASRATFGSDPKAAGFAAGKCDYLGSGADPITACSSTSTAQSSANATSPQSGSISPKCETPPASPGGGAVTLLNVCGKSFSDVSTGSPTGINEGGGGIVNLSLDLSQLAPGGTPQAEAAKDMVVDSLVSLLNTVGATVPNSQVQALKDEINRYLTSLKDGTKAGSIINGVASTNVTHNGLATDIVSSVAGVKVGLLGLTDPLTDGLVIIDVTGAQAAGTWNGATGLASASAVPGTATLKVLNLTTPQQGDYIVQTLSLTSLGQTLSVLDGTAVETTIKVIAATPPQTGQSVSASSGALFIHAAKGVGESSLGKKDGGIVLGLASADVSISGAPRITKVDSALPKTGGPARVLYLVAAVLLGAAWLARRGARLVRAGAR